MKRFIAHIGAPKTGSSSIQSYLCLNNLLRDEVTGGQACYFVVRNRRLITGEELRLRSMLHPLGYVASERDIGGMLEHHFDQVSNDMTVVLSQEGWFKNLYVLPDMLRLNVPIELILYVRPQLEWLESAWWQWFAWENPRKEFQEIATHTFNQEYLKWDQKIVKLLEQPGISKVCVRIHQSGIDPVERFLSTARLSPYKVYKRGRVHKNKSITSHHQRLYEALPWARSVHNGTLDGILTTVWPFGDKTQLPFDLQTAELISSTYRQCNENLLCFLDPDEATLMQNDPHWWNASSYFPGAENSDLT